MIQRQAVAKYRLDIIYSSLIRFSGLLVIAKKKKRGNKLLDMNSVWFDLDSHISTLSDTMFYLGCCTQLFGP